MKDLVEYLVESLVEHPEQVNVEETDMPAETLLELTVSSSDMGRVIGKGGRVINSIRALVQVAAAKQGQRVTLELLESGDQ